MRGRRRRRGGEDCLPNACNIFQHFVIPETQDAVAMFEEPTIADGVAPALGVLSAIHFDNEPFSTTSRFSLQTKSTMDRPIGS